MIFEEKLTPHPSSSHFVTMLWSPHQLLLQTSIPGPPLAAF